MKHAVVKPPRPELSAVSASATGAMASTSHPLATRAALQAMRRGGSAVDGYLAAAAVQAVVEPVMTTFAGGLLVAYWQAATNTAHIASGSFGRPAAEDGVFDAASRETSRTAMMPGWLNGAHAAWSRWGRLSWGEIFEEALMHAHDGFVVDQLLWGWMYEYRRLSSRLPDGRAIWHPDGYHVAVGDNLRQPDLARTIEAFADGGPEYFYRGDFAKRFVERVRADGGRMTLDDMSGHLGNAVVAPLGAVPCYRGHEFFGPGPLTALALNLVEAGDLRSRGRPADSAETLYLLMRIVEECWDRGLRFDPSMLSAEYAVRLWPAIENDPPRGYDPITPGTNALVVVDEQGDVAFGSHSCSSRPFGNGVVVDGVTVPRPLLFYADPVPLPTGVATAHLLVKDGRPVLAAGSPSISCFTNPLQNTVNVLEFSMNATESVHQPMFGAPHYPSRTAMVEGSFDEAVFDGLRERGMPFDRVSPWEPEMGSCHMVVWDEAGTMQGVADPRRLGAAAGY